MENKIKPGMYKHFKGDEVYVLGVGRHSETEEEMVFYEHLGGGETAGFWARPLKMFLEDVDKPEIGYSGPRFKFIRED